LLIVTLVVLASPTAPWSGLYENSLPTMVYFGLVALTAELVGLTSTVKVPPEL
jgi:hypothetical protein